MFRTLIYPSSGGIRVAGWITTCASACNTGTTPTQPHRNSNTHRAKNNTTNVVIQQNSRKLLMMDILMSETCWAHKKWNKIARDIRLVFYSSNITMVHGPVNIRYRETCLGLQSSGMLRSVWWFCAFCDRPPEERRYPEHRSGSLRSLGETRWFGMMQNVLWSVLVVLGVCLAILCYMRLARRITEICQAVSPSGVSWLVRLKLNGARRWKRHQWRQFFLQHHLFLT